MNNPGFGIRSVRNGDLEFWFSLDKHISIEEFDRKVQLKQGYVLCVGDKPVGILRYNLFWDNTPFCTMLYVAEADQKQGRGKALMDFWEKEMRALGYKLLLVSTQSDESAQFFYRKLGYRDCGGFVLPNEPLEIFLYKQI